MNSFPPDHPPVTLTIAGSDSSAGAGIQADLKTFFAFHTYGATAITSIVAEHPGRVLAISAVAPSLVGSQIEAVFDSLPVAAVKTGMLYLPAIVREVAARLSDLGPGLPLVVDPVLSASCGDPLSARDSLAALGESLFPLARLVTPNQGEAELLLGRALRSSDDLADAALALAKRFGVPFLLKGGHLSGESAVDVLAEGGIFRSFAAPRVPGASPHGTGCTLSAAITARLAWGDSLVSAIAAAKRWLTSLLPHTLRFGPYVFLPLTEPGGAATTPP
ncbi:bifunctional hydroxymethylpyrimidine kinase/phosphomethylpyrimidine kinase [Methylacidimicrobium tartarophylax]|uniref:hydroxymethylpyrimidine kinase n=1 Tax=Methylacidimicrobium tartarophylax TaxID=1041768 RepID=A0A5E6MJ67_9BACT|nr:bifunctional hydroxymethylpyrimidine kinase/phosphomethylpyrimidine kinase [Methylacidimicrobium tartarophylax]VVM06107.1 hydroxymethylpyrimidine/phosphomethylpyrimidine kinase [Methylacidimicrobium tartarophylax]